MPQVIERLQTIVIDPHFKQYPKTQKEVEEPKEEDKIKNVLHQIQG